MAVVAFVPEGRLYFFRTPVFTGNRDAPAEESENEKGRKGISHAGKDTDSHFD